MQAKAAFHCTGHCPFKFVDSPLHIGAQQIAHPAVAEQFLADPQSALVIHSSTVRVMFSSSVLVSSSAVMRMFPDLHPMSTAGSADACDMVQGVGTAQDIDTGMKLGTNQPMGPLSLADFIGTPSNMIKQCA